METNMQETTIICDSSKMKTIRLRKDGKAVEPRRKIKIETLEERLRKRS